MELEIESLAMGGRGVARHEGVVWLVDGALPGDRVEVVVVRAHPRWVEARTARVVSPSAARRTAVCPIQQSCGGCPWMTLDEQAQRIWKRTLLVDALERIGGVCDPPVDPTIPSPDPLGYRNKIELTFGSGAQGRPLLGYHPAGSAGEIVDVTRCAVADEVHNRVVAVARGFFVDGAGARSPALRAHPHDPLRLVLRSSRRTGQALVALRGPAGPFPELPAFARLVRESVREVVSVVRIETHAERRGGARTIPVSGPPWIEESLAGISFRLPAAAFFQINPAVAERLVGVVEDLAGVAAGERVLELYGGVGALSLSLARKGATALVCEADAEAVASGRRAAVDAGRLRVRYEREDVGRFLHRREAAGSRPPDVVLADPPRAGLGRSVAAALAALRAQRIVLVSCDPATLARDVKEFLGRGYRLVRVVPLDMFPQTPHVEGAALLLRAAS